jgi:hypothetical protein
MFQTPGWLAAAFIFGEIFPFFRLGRDRLYKQRKTISRDIWGNLYSPPVILAHQPGLGLFRIAEKPERHREYKTEFPGQFTETPFIP